MTIVNLPEARRGKRRVAGEMNKTERAYAEHLEAQLRRGEILAWRFEAITLKIGNDCRLTPDFLVWFPGGRIEFHDTKGTKWTRTAAGFRVSRAFIHEDARVKLAAAAHLYPWWAFRVVWQVRPGEWESKRL